MSIKKLEFYNDDRASRFFDLYDELDGQVTASAIEPNQFSGWHMHELQYDKFTVVLGKVKVGVIEQNGTINEYILDSKDPSTLHILPTQIHCYKNFDEKSLLIYYLSQKHNEGDEFRFTEEEIFKKYNYKI
jgi:dTDP-4-dehydrorhamnose 3,5-epimerase-like enzyme